VTSTPGDVAAALARGRLLLTRAVRRAWEARLVRRDGHALSATELEPLMQELERPELLARSPRTEAPAPASVAALGALCRSVGAPPVAEELLALGCAVELDPAAHELAAHLRGAGGGLTVRSVAFAVGEARAPELLMALGAGAPLRLCRLVDVQERAGEPFAAATVRVAPRVVRWLIDRERLDDEVAGLATLERSARLPALGAAGLAVVAAAVDEVAGFLAEERAATRASGDLVLRGPRGSGRGEIAREACRRLGVPLVRAPLSALLAQPQPAEAAATLLREALLLDAQLLLEGAELLAGGDEPARRVRAALAASSRPLLFTAIDRVRLERNSIVREVAIPGAHQREAVWRDALPSLAAPALGSLYRVGVGAIGRVAAESQRRARLRGDERVINADVAQAVRGEFETDLGSVATRVEVTQTWRDLVVPEDTRRAIGELVQQLRHRSTVLGRWGFQRKLGKGIGTVALFSGEPGTGKSMVAGLIARELGLELYQIDLARVVSKWIGETEKNLARVFDAAETGHVVLLFDEADALLGKRSADPKSATDRYANMETNYVLQRLESFHGVAILTSNLESSIDPALARRLSFELSFPFPDEEQRAVLWRRMLPDELPLVGAIDFELLADRFELAGGHIRNIVLRAAYLAAADGEGLAMQHILRAAESEYRDRGRLVARGRLAG
jgi:hypothetical protein